MKSNAWRFIIAVLLAGFVGEFIHTHVGIGGAFYGTFIDVIAYLTKPEEAIGVAILYYLMGDRLPTRSRLLKGILLALILLLVKGQLIRQPLMNWLLPNTLKEVFLYQLQVWLSNFAMAMIITWIIRPKYDVQIKS